MIIDFIDNFLQSILEPIKIIFNFFSKHATFFPLDKIMIYLLIIYYTYRDFLRFSNSTLDPVKSVKLAILNTKAFLVFAKTVQKLHSKGEL